MSLVTTVFLLAKYSNSLDSSSAVGLRSRFPPPPISPKCRRLGRASPTISGSLSRSTLPTCRSTVPRVLISMLMV